MLNKIDKRLLNKIHLQSIDKNYIDVIIRFKDFSKRKSLLSFLSESMVELPLISSVGIKVKKKDIIKLVNFDEVEYIHANLTVCKLIYNSKKHIKLKNIEDCVNNNIQHSCAVIDTGIYPHIDFCLGRKRIIKFVDLINDKSEPYDDNGHGTFVTGVLAGNAIIDKYSGIDNNTDIISIKALDQNGETTTLKILQAMQWVIDNKDRYNIKVVCMSFGTEIEEVSDPLIYGAEVLWDNGIVVVTAGGNSGPENSTIMSPGASSKIITVGAMSVEDNKYSVADFSSRGPILGNYKPDMIVPGVDIISTNIFDDTKEFYTKMSGTSVATPMVAGVASLLLKINPNYTPNQIKYMLVNSCKTITGDRNSEGFGRLDLSQIKLL